MKRLRNIYVGMREKGTRNWSKFSNRESSKKF